MRALFSIPLFILLAGCFDQPDCLITSTNLLKVAFKNKSDGKDKEITFTSITASGANKEFYKDQKATSVSLPVNPSAGSTVLTFYFEGQSKTLEVAYTADTRVISPDCGAYLYFSNLSVSSTDFGEVKLIQDQLLINAAVNVEILL